MDRRLTGDPEQDLPKEVSESVNILHSHFKAVICLGLKKGKANQSAALGALNGIEKKELMLAGLSI